MTEKMKSIPIPVDTSTDVPQDINNMAWLDVNGKPQTFPIDVPANVEKEIMDIMAKKIARQMDREMIALFKSP